MKENTRGAAVQPKKNRGKYSRLRGISVPFFSSILFAEMKTSTSKDFAYAMTMLKVLSWPVGTWPLQDYDIFSAIRVAIVSLLLLLMLIILHTEMYLDSSDAEKNLDSIILASCAVLAILKVGCFYIWCDGLTANFASAVEDYDNLRREDERVIVRWHAYMGRVATVCVIFGAYFSSFSFMLVATFAKEKEAVNGTKKDGLKYPIPCEYTMQIINLPKNLTSAVFTVEYVMLMTTGNANLGSDALFLSITFHLCGQVAVLRLKFDKFMNQNGRGREQFNALIERHIYLLNLAKMLNETISSILIVQLSTSSILICTTGFQFILSLTTANIIMIAKTFLVLNTLLVQIFGYCYVGEYLKRQMEGIGYTIYFCNWYNVPKSMAKDIIYVIMRAQEPVLLKAGKLFLMNMETYMSIIKSSMSYLSVLRLMVDV